MNDRCGYCGDPYEQDRCPNCGRIRDARPWPFLVLGPGYMGDYRTVGEAQGLIERNSDLGPAGLYIRVDVAVAWGMNAAMVQPMEDA